MVVSFLAIKFYPGHGFTEMFSNVNLWKSLGASLIYMHNIIYPNALSVNPVAWSLEIEIQFYLLVPLLVLMLKLPKIYRRSLIGFLIFFFVFLQNTFPTTVLTIYSFIQYFLIGFLLVDVYLSGYQSRLNPILSFFSGVGLFLSMVYLDLYRNNWYEYIFVVILFAFGVLSLTDKVWKRILSIRILTSIGGMCYSIYLWHNLVVSAAGNFTIKFNISHSYVFDLLWHYLILFPIILLFSTCFYVLVEKPCMDKEWPLKLYGYIIKKIRFAGKHS
jgi:peptidoglycan/LPS O-acetylase OafA/YrhL